MTSALHLFFQSISQEQREVLLHANVKDDNARSHSRRRRRLDQHKRSDSVSHHVESSRLDIPSLSPLSPSFVKAKASITKPSRWGEEGPALAEKLVTLSPRRPRRSSTGLDHNLPVTSPNTHPKNTERSSMDSVLSPNSQYAPSCGHDRIDRFATSPTSIETTSSSTLKDATLQRMHKKNILSPSIPKRKVSFCSGLPDSPPLWDGAERPTLKRTSEEMYISKLQNLEQLLGEALEHCSIGFNEEEEQSQMTLEGSQEVSSSSSSSSLAVI